MKRSSKLKLYEVVVTNTMSTSLANVIYSLDSSVSLEYSTLYASDKGMIISSNNYYCRVWKRGKRECGGEEVVECCGEEEEGEGCENKREEREMRVSGEEQK